MGASWLPDMLQRSISNRLILWVLLDLLQCGIEPQFTNLQRVRIKSGGVFSGFGLQPHHWS